MNLSIILPTYNGSLTLKETLVSILRQNFTDFEIILVDDNSTDNTIKIVESFNDGRIKIFRFKENIGYAKNLARGLERAMGEIIFLFAQDDILAAGALKKTHDAFLISDQIGVVSRPYFWFDKDIKKPVRAVLPYNKERDEILSVENTKDFVAVINSIGQLSGLAWRKKFFNVPANKNCFVAHVYPFLGIFKNQPIVFLKDYTVAVRISSSQTRFNAKIYDPSPLKTWVLMLRNLLPEQKFKKSRQAGIKHATRHFIGLVQIKNYAPAKFLWREIGLHLKYRPINIFEPGFWFYTLLCLLVPSFILWPLTDWYKEKINARTLPKINFFWHQS